MKDKDQIKYYKENNILKGPDDYDNSNNEEPAKKCPFCGEEQDEYFEKDIRDFDRKYFKVPLKYLIYYGLIKCDVKKCNNCGALWHGDVFVYDDEYTFKRRWQIIPLPIFIILGIILFTIIPKPAIYGVLLLLFLAYLFWLLIVFTWFL